MKITSSRNNKRYFMKYYILILLLITSNLLLAQSTMFEGVWILENKEHVRGPEYINALPTQFIFSNAKDSFVVQFIIVGADGKESRSRVANALDGTETLINTADHRKVKRKIQFTNESNEITITTAFFAPDNENEVDFTRVERLRLVNGHLHINKKSVETNSETWEVNGVYKKK